MGALTTAEKALLRRVFAVESPRLTADRLAALDRLAGPIQQVTSRWDAQAGVFARNAVLAEVHRRQTPYWDWDEDIWLEMTGARQTADNRNARLHLVALGHRLGGHHRLHRRAGVVRVRALAVLLFDTDRVDAALKDARDTLRCWGVSEKTLEHQVGCALCDLMLSCDTTDLRAIAEDQLRALVAVEGQRLSSRTLAAHPRLGPRRVAGLGATLATAVHPRARHGARHVHRHPDRGSLGHREAPPRHLTGTVNPRHGRRVRRRHRHRRARSVGAQQPQPFPLGPAAVRWRQGSADGRPPRVLLRSDRVGVDQAQVRPTTGAEPAAVGAGTDGTQPPESSTRSHGPSSWPPA